MAKERIAILGGGAAALTTAFELTRASNWQDRYEITVYQMGWRLGGKGASGRNVDHQQRIEEHGLHVFFGFYENAFRLLRDVYEALDRDPKAPLARWDDAFKPHDFVAITDSVGGHPFVWPLTFPRRDDTPGDGGSPPSNFDIARMILEFNVDFLEDWLLANDRALSLLPRPAADVLRSWRKWLEKALDSDDDGRLLDDLLLRMPGIREGLRGAHDLATQVFDDTAAPRGILERMLKDTIGRFIPDSLPFVNPLAGAWLTLQATRTLALRLDTDPGAEDLDRLIALLEGVRQAARIALDERAGLESLVYRLFVVIDLSVTTLIGLIRDDLMIPPVDWFKIDDEDIKTWFARHGAHQRTID